MVLVLLAFSSFPTGHTTTLTLFRSRFIVSVSATLSPGDGTTATQSLEPLQHSHKTCFLP